MGKRRDAPADEAMSELEFAARAAITAAGGDTVVALLSPLAKNPELKRKLALSLAEISNGFSRG